MDGAEQVRHLVDAFDSVGWWTLRPATGVIGRTARRAKMYTNTF